MRLCVCVWFALAGSVCARRRAAFRFGETCALIFALLCSTRTGYGSTGKPAVDLFFLSEAEYQQYLTNDTSKAFTPRRSNRNLRFFDDGDVYVDRQSFGASSTGAFYLVIDNTSLFKSSLGNDASPPLGVSSSVTVRFQAGVVTEKPNPGQAGECDQRYIHSSFNQSLLLAPSFVSGLEDEDVEKKQTKVSWSSKYVPSTVIVRGGLDLTRRVAGAHTTAAASHRRVRWT